MNDDEMTTRILNRNACVYQTADEIYHLIELPFE